MARRNAAHFREVPIRSINELIDEALKLHADDFWIFRGVGDATHDLVPSIGRPRKVAKPPAPAEERALLNRFKDRLLVQIPGVPNELGWLVLAQHHRLPTRLLDWTTSPLVAAFFSLNNFGHSLNLHPLTIREVLHDVMGRNPEFNWPTGVMKIQAIPLASEVPGAIYAVKSPPEVTLQDSKRPFAIRQVKLVVPARVSERVAPQLSVLTIHPMPTKPWRPREGVKFTFSTDVKREFRKQLPRLGIRHDALFPGIDGIADELRTAVKWGERF